MSLLSTEFRTRWRELTQVFLTLGTMSHGGTAMIGVVQADVQEKRRWLSKESFLKGWALVNLLPGASMLQLCIFLGYRRDHHRHSAMAAHRPLPMMLGGALFGIVRMTALGDW